jgi:osmotically-inducible protein OsmY
LAAIADNSNISQRSEKEARHAKPKGSTVMTKVNGRLIEEEAERRLQQSLYPELRRILCNFRHGILTLYGVVSSFHVRQIAQELVQGLEGIEIIDNQLVVTAKEMSSISDNGAISDGAGSTGFKEPELRKVPEGSRTGPASSDAL